MFEKMLTLQLELLLMMIVGFIVKKKKIISVQQQKGLSELLLNVILPATIIKSFITSSGLSTDLLANSISMMATCLIIQIVLIITLPILLRPFKEKAKIMEYGLLVSNSSFIGLPVIEYLFDSQAVMYASIYLIPFRFIMWTVGLSLFTDELDLKSGLKKMLLHPCIISVVIGSLIMLLHIQLPQAITGTVEIISSASNCLSMITIGAVLADIKWNKLLDLSTIAFTIARLIILPLIVYYVLSLLKADSLLIDIAVLMSAMPCGSTCPVLAQKYDKDYEFAAKLVLITSILSTITIPCICLLLD